jgi:molecular chaperone DnaK
VVEILSSHGDARLGGDDFDQRLLDHVCDRFQAAHGIDLRESVAARSRLLAAVEEAKKRLSSEPVVTMTEEFIAEQNGVPLHLTLDIDLDEYDRLIEPLVAKTLRAVDDALTDAKLAANQIHKVLLVGGATRTPLVRRLLQTRLGRPVHSEIEPDLAVALGAGVQAGLIAGVDVGPVLVDITPHTLGVAALDWRDGVPAPHAFSPIIERNSPLPVTRTQIYSTAHDFQAAAEIRIFQGESDDTRMNEQVGEFLIEGLAQVRAPNELLVRLDLDLDGILRVTATERATGLAKRVIIDNAIERFRKKSRLDAKSRIDALIGSTDSGPGPNSTLTGDVLGSGSETVDADDLDDPELSQAIAEANGLIAKSRSLADGVGAEDAAEMQDLIRELQSSIARRSLDAVRRTAAALEDLVFYLAD